jgi:hypothetical protein
MTASDRRARQRGVAAVEFGIVLIPLLLIVFGVTEFGRAMYQYNALTKSVRSAARHLTANDHADLTVRRQAECLAVYARPELSGVTCKAVDPVVPGLDIGKVSIYLPENQPSLIVAGKPLGIVTVTIAEFNFESLVPWVMPSIEFGPISARMPVNQ